MTRKEIFITSIWFCLVLIIILAISFALVYKKQGRDNKVDVLKEQPLTQEEIMIFAESLKSTTTISSEEMMEIEKFADSLVGTSTWDTMTPEQQAKIIKSAEALKSN